jgi:hypothetical protein
LKQLELGIVIVCLLEKPLSWIGGMLKRESFNLVPPTGLNLSLKLDLSLHKFCFCFGKIRYKKEKGAPVQDKK